MKPGTFVSAFAAALIASAAAAQQPAATPPAERPSGKIGFVDTELVNKRARMTRSAKQALDDKFKKRAEEIQAGPADQVDRRMLALDEDYRLESEDAQRQYADRTIRLIRRIAMEENIDVVFLEAAYYSPRIDLTEKVIQALDAEP